MSMLFYYTFEARDKRGKNERGFHFCGVTNGIFLILTRLFFQTIDIMISLPHVKSKIIISSFLIDY